MYLKIKNWRNENLNYFKENICKILTESKPGLTHATRQAQLKVNL